jgi:trehalose synthase
LLQAVDVGRLSLSAYRGIAPEETLDQLRTLGRDLTGARVLHVNATPYGGGVSELLRSEVPLLNDLGLVADWKVITGDDAFFKVTKLIHNALQGAPTHLTAARRAAYELSARRNAEAMQEDYDFVFIHDPQPAAILRLRGKGSARWIWRCHIDTSSPNPEVWAFLRDFLSGYDAAVFTMPEFVPPGLPVDRVAVIPPAIDPLSPKNMNLSQAAARRVLNWIGIDPYATLITQVSRFDPWKDPLGVIAAYRLVREEVPNLQLALVGSMALDDPEGWSVYQKIDEARESDPQIHVFTNLTGVGNIEVNAFQRMSQVVVQKSIREGFGLVVSEALWKGTPVVAGLAGGIPLQMADGVGGALVTDVQGCAEAILALLADKPAASVVAARGRERVRQHFLLPRLLVDELGLVRELSKGRPVPQADREHRDPVCGMALGQPAGRVTVRHAGRDYLFCSDYCRQRFLAFPARYLAGGRSAAAMPLSV